MPDDYYRTLDVPRSASGDEIQKAYRRLARKYHPDLYADKSDAEKDRATKKFQQIQQAYDVLGDAEKRQMYDQFGPEYERMRAGGGGQPFDFSQVFGQGGPGGGPGGMGSLEDLLRQFGMQGGMGGMPPGGRPGGSPPGPRKGENLEQEITVAFGTSVLGGEHQVSVDRANKVETIAIKIPPGIESGKKIRVRGQGRRGFEGGERGDLMIRVKVAPHPVYTRSGLNLKVTVPITLKEAVEGAKVDLPTPHGTISMTVPAGTASGKSLRLKNMGIKTPQAGGDIIATLQITMPAELSDEDRKLVEQLELAWNGQSPRDGLMW
ncbi:MAG: DnaJ C-terminal domain-containing protein [Planctomycetota bacterium]